MAKLSISIEDLPETIHALASTEAQIRTIVNLAIRRSLAPIATVLRKQIRMNAPVDTGRLKKSIRSRRVRKGTDYSIQIHFIDRAGKSVFYGYINNAVGKHKGWADQGVENSLPEIRSIIQDKLSEAFREQGF